MSRLLPLILARRSFPRPRAPFAPRELSAEEHASLAAMSARGQWDRAAAERDATPGLLAAMVERAQVAQRRRAPLGVQMEIDLMAGLLMPDQATWGAR